MDFGQLCAAVSVLTNRPDLIADTQLAVRRATLYFHGLDTWYRDLVERRFDYPAIAYNFSLSIRDDFVNFRKLKYLKAVVPDSGTVIKELSYCGPDNLFDEFGALKTDIWYGAGTKLNFKTRDPQSSFLVAYFQYPNVNDAYDSWLADMYPYAIIDEAAGRVMHAIGDIDSGNKFVDPAKGLVATIHIPWLKANALTPEA